MDSDRYKGVQKQESFNNIERSYYSYNKDKTSHRGKEEEQKHPNGPMQFSQTKESFFMKRNGAVNESKQSIPLKQNSLDGLSQINEKNNPASPMTHREESILNFTDPQRSLMGRISIYKINFKKNLRRF